MDRIKRLSYEVLGEYKSKFGEDFADNKKALSEIAVIRSKGLKNKIAGYITKFIKKEIREEKVKQERIDASKTEQEEQAQMELENATKKAELDSVASPDLTIPTETLTPEPAETVSTPTPEEPSVEATISSNTEEKTEQ